MAQMEKEEFKFPDEIENQGKPLISWGKNIKTLH